MSKGSQVIPVRLGDELLRELDKEIQKQNRTRHDEPYTRSSWIRKALADRFAHLSRSRAKKTS